MGLGAKGRARAEGGAEGWGLGLWERRRRRETVIRWRKERRTKKINKAMRKRKRGPNEGKYEEYDGKRRKQMNKDWR